MDALDDKQKLLIAPIHSPANQPAALQLGTRSARRYLFDCKSAGS